MKVRVGDEIDVDGVSHLVVKLSAQIVALRKIDTGITTEILMSDFVRLPRLKPSTPGTAEIPGAELAVVQYLDDTAREQTDFWLRQLRDLRDSLDTEKESASAASSAMQAKLDELAALGRPVTLRTLQRKLKAYRQSGVAGLIDHRQQRSAGERRRVDARVVAALSEVMEAQTNASTGTRTRLIELTRQLLKQRFGAGAVDLPALRTMFRLIDDLDRGRMTTGSAKTRRSLANRPDRAFSAMGVSRPGEQVQIDSTPLDVLVRLDGGLIDRPELTIMLDVATRSIISAVLRPGTTKSVDLVVVLARALVPYDSRPGGRAETRALVNGAFELQQLLGDQDYDSYRRQQPYIFPETITTDRGLIYISEHFRTACEQLGISLNVSAPYTPTDKGKVERTFQSINTGFTQYLKNYTGRGVEYRGLDAEPETLHSLVELQELLDEWIAVVWQNRPHDSLRDPLHPSVSLSPNEMCRAYRELVPELEIPFDVNTYISLLPVVWRKIQAYGISIDNRIYDAEGLREFRRTESTYTGQGGKWPIHVDPYNVQTVWIAIGDEWLPLQWAYAAAGPMSADVWAGTRQSGFFAQRRALEADIAERSADILARAGAGRSQESLTAARSRTVNLDLMRLSELHHQVPVAEETEAKEDEGNMPDGVETSPVPRFRFGLLNIREEVERMP
jgi:putative transposase